jgi:hypothetical protein
MGKISRTVRGGKEVARNVRKGCRTLDMIMTCENGVWRIKYNDELYGLYKDLDVVRVIKVSRIRWLGHLVRMEENSPCKKITFSQPEGSRKKGRPKLRCKVIESRDMVEEST